MYNGNVILLLCCKMGIQNLIGFSNIRFVQGLVQSKQFFVGRDRQDLPKAVTAIPLIMGQHPPHPTGIRSVKAIDILHGGAFYKTLSGTMSSNCFKYVQIQLQATASSQIFRTADLNPIGNTGCYELFEKSTAIPMEDIHGIVQHYTHHAGSLVDRKRGASYAIFFRMISRRNVFTA